MTQRRSRQSRGFILITVLWIGLGLLLAVAAFLATTRQDALTVRAEVNAARAGELARSGLNLALADLGRISADQLRTPHDGTPVAVQMAEGMVTYRIFDEAGKIDILRSPARMVAPALVQIGEAEGLDSFDAVNIADALENLVDTQDGTVRSVYSALTSAGLSGQTALAASRYLTTLNLSSRVNPLTAPRPVLAAIPGLGPSDVEEIVARRETGRPMPIFGSAAVWLVEQSGPAFTIEAEAVLTTGGRALLRAQVVQQGLSFRGGLMRYDILTLDVVR
jgi:general secretion pathway protein K